MVNSYTIQLNWFRMEDTYADENYLLSNDLRPVSNGSHRLWARLFNRSLKLTIFRLNRTSFKGFESTTFTPAPEKKRRSWLYAQGSKDTSRSIPKVSEKTKRLFKFGLEIPPKLSDILRIDEAAGITLWKDSAEK